MSDLLLEIPSVCLRTSAILIRDDTLHVCFFTIAAGCNTNLSVIYGSHRPYCRWISCPCLDGFPTYLPQWLPFHASDTLL
jgi:hypothetical protein